MRPEEATWIGEAMAKLDSAEVATVLNIGSSTGRFRTLTQPHIDREIFAPLTARGARVVHCDMKADEGVDQVGDLLDPAFRARLETLGADVVLATNLFEHVEDREALAGCLAALPRSRGRLIVSVPYRYPYHADPIDTLYRPAPEAIAGLFPGFYLENAEIIESTSLWEDLRAQLGPSGAVKDVARRLARLLVPFVRPRAWRATAANLAWLFRKRSVSVACLARSAPGAANG
jgi:SAM-dependent methyltransferase